MAAVVRQARGDDPAKVRAPGVRAFYRAVIASSVAEIAARTRGRPELAVEIGLLASYVVMRTADLPMGLWTMAIIATAVIAPGSALTVLVGVAPFTEWLLLDRDTGAKVLVIAVLGVGLAVRVGVGRSWRRPDAVAITSVLLLGLLALSVAHAAIRFGPDIGRQAVVGLLAGLGGGIIVLGVARRTAAAGSLRPLIVGVGAIVVAAAASLLDYLQAGALRSTPLDWLVRPLKVEFGRLSGVIPAPNATAALLLAALAVLAAMAFFYSGRRRLLLLVPILLLGLGTFFTYSRSGLIATCLLAVVIALRWRFRVGVAVLLVAILVVTVLAPTYLTLRAHVLGIEVHGDWLTLISGDVKRLDGWIGAWRMWLAAPLTGFGWQSFHELHADFGVTSVSAPHNELLRLFAEGGIATGLVFVGFLAVVMRRLWRDRTPVAIGALGAIVTLMTCAMFNNPFGYVQLMAPVFAIVGVAIGAGDRSHPASGPADVSLRPAPS